MADNSESALSDLLYKTVEEQPPTEAVTEEEAPEVEETEVEEESEQSDEDQSETEETDESEETEAVFTVKVRGEEKQVNQKELINGYQRAEDYAIATRELKEQQKVVTETKTKADEALKLLGDIAGEVQTLVMGDVNNVNWDELRTTDPSEYLRMKEVVAAREKALAEIVKKRNAIAEAKTVQESEALHKALSWSDPAKKEADIKAITDFMTAEGITETVTSHKLMLAILNAAKYRELQATKKKVIKEVKQAPKTTKPVKVTKAPAPKTLAERLYANS